MYDINWIRSPYWIAGLMSLLISFVIYIQFPVINPDAICYLKSAEAMHKGITYGMHLCGQAGWPFYSILIAFIHSLTPLTFESSAYLLNGLFSLMTVLLFIKITSILAKTEERPNILWLAALVILTANIFNDVNHYIVKDHGYWVFYLLSIYCLLKFFKTRIYYYALAFSVSAIFATLFRIEGVIFLVLPPFLVFFNKADSLKTRLKDFLVLNVLLLLGILLIGILFLSHKNIFLGRLQEINGHRFLHFIETLKNKRNALASILSVHAEKDATVVFYFTLLSWYFYKIITNVSLVYFILVLYAWWKKIPRLSSMTRVVLFSYVIFYVILTLLFLTENLFISKRYLVGLSLTLMLWVPFVLLKFLKQWQQHKIILSIIGFSMLLNAASGIYDFGYSKQYIQSAGQWVQTHVPFHATLYSNDMLFMYYSKHYGDNLFKMHETFSQINLSNLKEYDFIALRMNKKDLKKASNMVESLHMQPIQVFSNARGDQVRIYRRTIFAYRSDWDRLCWPCHRGLFC